MTRFVDEYLPDCVNSYNALTGVRSGTDIVGTDNGGEAANRRLQSFRYDFIIPGAVRDWSTFYELRDHFKIMGGPFQTFPFKDPLDFASINPSAPATVPTISDTDQEIGTGTGVKTKFQLIRTYTRGSNTYTRTIIHPVVSSVVVSLDDVSQPSGWSVSRTTGELSFDSAPGDGVVVKVGFLFDCEVRYESDDALDLIARAVQAGQYADIMLKDVRGC